MNSYRPIMDLAGEVCFKPTFWQIKARVNHLITKYLSYQIICDRLEDLPVQFNNPQPRSWPSIDWSTITSEQIIGIELEVFLKILQGTFDTEAPIRGYTQTSRQYLEPIHPTMARFVGGTVDEQDKMLELGLWEKEERRHAPALMKIYQQLTRQKANPNLRKPKIYQPSANPQLDLYHHGLHRIATEYSAVCLYLWLMSRTTGTIQQVIGELLEDEINHMSKFWGFGQWLYPIPPKSKSRMRGLKHLATTMNRMTRVLHWDSWAMTHKIELIYSFSFVFKQMQGWSNCLTRDYLQSIFASPSISEKK
ncbi:hypothetical protein Xen7305DRAFT_00017960 [Xenococcus sp. PCC 7305]|uniref:hypothetical protein n=1 Tax=Xenococcus sp. PCC 7305 TaxID=102125 RepID=UPI0002ABFCA4|nr:hypothetical protein [Xenococcus sp. PCC 7305]ELS02085.1 hypothetical protein Xen7305DRAFT_00017960 [Xenococcus sp. PCC 7305]